MEKKFSPDLERTTPENYINSKQYDRFYSNLILPQFLLIFVYILISVGIFIIVFYASDASSSEHLVGLLPVASVVAMLQFKSFISLLIKSGAYYMSYSKVVMLVNRD